MRYGGKTPYRLVEGDLSRYIGNSGVRRLRGLLEVWKPLTVTLHTTANHVLDHKTQRYYEVGLCCGPSSLSALSMAGYRAKWLTWITCLGVNNKVRVDFTGFGYVWVHNEFHDIQLSQCTSMWSLNLTHQSLSSKGSWRKSRCERGKIKSVGIRHIAHNDQLQYIGRVCEYKLLHTAFQELLSKKCCSLRC